MRAEDIKVLLRERCDEPVKTYVHHVLRKRYQARPEGGSRCGGRCRGGQEASCK